MTMDQLTAEFESFQGDFLFSTSDMKGDHP